MSSFVETVVVMTRLAPIDLCADWSLPGIHRYTQYVKRCMEGKYMTA